MKALLVVVLAAAILMPLEGLACDLVPAWASDLLTVGDYVQIGDRQGDGVNTCYGESLDDQYTFGIVGSCDGSANLFNGTIEGDSLSGVYEVRSVVSGVGGYCIKLCACE